MGRKTRQARNRRHSAKRSSSRGKRHASPGTKPPPPGSVQRAMVGYGLMAVSATAALVLITGLEPWICWAVGVNTTVLIAFSFDKGAATRNQWRIPEVVLHALAAAGGSPMAWVARPLFNHKTSKKTFGRTLAIITGIQLVAALGLAYYLWG